MAVYKVKRGYSVPPSVLFLYSFQKRTIEHMAFMGRCPFCHQTDSVYARRKLEARTSNGKKSPHRVPPPPSEALELKNFQGSMQGLFRDLSKIGLTTTHSEIHSSTLLVNCTGIQCFTQQCCLPQQTTIFHPQ